MAENPFLKSPLEDQFSDTPTAATPATTASRGIAPSRDDVIRRARELDIDPNLALSFFSQESSGNWSSKDSPKGAKGGMQVMPGTYRSMMGTEAGQENPWNNMEAGLRYIAYGQKRLGTKDPELLAAGYHAGYDRKDLKAGIIPNTSDGMISTRDYAKSVAARLGKATRATNAGSVDDQFSDTPIALEDEFSDIPITNSATATPDATQAMPVLAQADIENKPYLDRLTEETKAGFGDMARSLETARWALGGGDSAALAEEMAKSFQQQAATPKTKAQQEIDAAYKGVTDAKGVIDTTKAGAKALWASITNPKETSIEIARNAANSLPTLAGGAAGAGTGAAIGAGVGAAGAGVGAVPGAIAGAVLGGRSGMAVGTTATELGAEIQDMVQKRLADSNQAPTAQNILAIISDKQFKDAALKQGMAKGLTVAAVDQVFLGLGGKIATAPARKIASRELAEQGMDMATRAARKEALASPAGKAALEAAKPSIAARIGAGAAAVGVDAAGESIGEGLSQKVARGEVDYGDALREGVVSIGQSVAETAVGHTIETAKQAAATAKGAVMPTAKAPSTASGPLARATENAASEPERVTVTAPDGQVSGTVTGQTADAVQIVGDDGQVYNFKTGPDGVQITPEAPNTPLSNALEVAANENAEALAAPVVAPEAVAPAPEMPVPAPVTLSAVPAERPPEPTIAEMSDDELRARLKYIADQAKTNGGWNKMLVQKRREVEREINARAPKVETPKVEQPALDLKPAEATVKETLTPEPVAKATPSQKAAASLPKELSGAKPRYNYGNKTFELNFASDIDRAAYITAQGKTSSRDADYLAFVGRATGMTEDEVRAHGRAVREAIKQQAKDAKPGTLKVPEVARDGVKVELTSTPASEPVADGVNGRMVSEHKTRPEAFKAMEAFNVATVAKTENGKWGVFTNENPAPVSQPAPTGGTSEEGAGASQPPQAASGKPKTASKEDVEHLFGVDSKRAAALDRIAAGKAWFNDGVKAKDFIAKNGLKDTHEVKRGKGGRFDVVAKAAPAVSQWTQGKTVNDWNEWVKDYGDGLTASVVQAGPKSFVSSLADAAGSPSNSFRTLEESQQATDASAERLKKKEAINGNDTSAERKPAGPEAVEQKADAGQAPAAAVQPAAKEEVAYSLPDNVGADWNRVEAEDFEPTPRQKIVMDATEKALGEGLFYNREVDARVAEMLGITPETRQRNKTRVEGGDFGYDVYNARRAVEAKQRHATHRATREAMNLKAGDSLGTLVFNDFKVNTNVTVESVSGNGKEVTIKGKRGPYSFTATTSPFDIKVAMDRAKERGKRKDGFEEFVAKRAPAAPAKEEVTAPAPGTRVNGNVERAAADRLEKLHEQMGNITQRNSREGNSKAAVRTIIEELRKPKTVSSIVPMLEDAASGLDKNFSAMADVLREVADSLGEKTAVPVAEEKPAIQKSLGEQLAEVNAELERQSRVQNASTRAKRDAIRKQIAEQDFPEILAAVDGDIDVAEDLNRAFQYAGEEPRAKTINRVLRKRGIEPEYGQRWANRLLAGQQGKPATVPQSLGEGLERLGFTKLERSDPRRFQKYGTWERDGVRVALSGQVTGVERGTVMKYQADNGEMTIEAIITDAAQRGNGRAKKALGEIAKIADSMGITLYAEPVQMEAGEGLTVQQLNSLYGSFGFEPADKGGLVLERKPNAEPKQEAKATPAVSENTIFTEDAAAKARALLKRRLGQLNSGVDPELMQAGITLAGYHIEKGARTFAAYAKAMLEDLGDTVKPYLKSWYMGVKYDPRATAFDGMSTAAEVEGADVDAFAAQKDTQPSTEAEGNDDGSQKLDQPGPRELAGEQPNAVQGTKPQRQAGAGTEASGGADTRGNERAGGAGPEQSGSLGNDAGEVSTLATRRNARRGGEQGGGAVQRGKRAAKPDSANGERGNQLDLIPADGQRAQDRADGFVITDEDAIGEGGQKTKFKQNVAAIRLLKQLSAENRQATRAEQSVLAKYVGWGGIPQAFYRDNGEVSKGWEKEAAELKELMTDAELAAAAASTRNAHYTSPEIVAAVWDAAKHFGFQGGRVLEPSVGVGNFFGLMPTALRSASQLTGVELDHITGGIAKQLYPQANIQAPVGFQDFSAPDNYFDLAIGNPPFGREGIYDATRRKISGFSIHNYFFAKSIDTVKPNGVLAMVVTNRLLDSIGDKARQYIADRAEFLGAIRLPNNAFLKNAGTEVTTDIIFLRKLKDGEQPSGQRWMDVKQVTDKNGKTVPLNEYFVRNPDMMLGEFGAYGSMYSPDDPALVARPGQDTPALMREAMANLPSGFMDPPSAAPVLETVEPMHDVSHVKIGSVFEQDGQIFERREDMLGKQQAVPVTFANDKAKERVSGMIRVRDALIDVRRLQLKEKTPEANLAAARAALNEEYDAFVKANGPINADANKRLMRDDPTWPQLAALEEKFDKGISATVAKTTGEKARPASAEKAAIFFKRTQSPYKPPEKASSAKDAMVTSLSERGRVDLDYMSSLYGKTPEAIARELEGLIFKNPAGGWESRDQYLSGNVKKKLAQALDAAKSDPAMKANVEALREVQPSDIEAVDIDVKVGAHWVPADVMQTFVAHITEGQNVKAVYNPIKATWTLNADRVPQSALTQWGTDRASVTKILEAAANAKQITIYDEHRDGTRTLNEAATTAANEKVERVKAEWNSWIWADDSRRERLHRIYNDTFNTDVQRDYDGSHLTFPGKVGNDIIQLRPHQSNAVWRIVQSGTTLLDHVVGAGKTFTMIAGIMEMRRMGLANKPMLVVPNHLVGQWAEDFMKLYPGANILAATKKDFEKDNRKRLFARIATGDWDAVIVAHSSFGKVEVEPEFQAEFIKQQISDMNTSIEAMRAAEGKGSRNVKQIEKQKAALEEKLKKLFDTGSKDDNLYFGELGVDAVLLDEAHEFKNLGFSTGMQRVAGLGNPAGSNKAADMFMKVQSVLKRTGGKNVVFATGTPISNTMAEMYTMQRYLDYGTLKDQGIAHFDAWAKTFGEVVTDWELSPSGQYKMNSRFAKFVNMPELMQRYQSFADVINRDDINRQLAAQGKKLPVPKIKSGKPENIVVERSQDQARYIGIPTVDENGVEKYPKGSLIWRSENLPKKAEKGADNMLKIMSDARKAALDMRLIDPGYPDNPGSKVNVAAQNIKATYDKWEKDKGTQLVFIDLSTPKGAMAKEAAALRELVRLAEEGDEAAQEKLDAMSPDELLALDSSFSVYDDLKAKLIGLGIPENEIAFIHDANTELQKEDLFGKVRSGRVRVLFGSTAKMGAGMNVQERLVALHHLDAPWRPSDLEQREGRIIRQGNKLYESNPEGFEVEIKRYATKQTLDSRMWQTIEAKAKFIEQVRKGAGNTREIEDIAGEAANSAEMKAASSGNPLILEEMSLRQAIRKLENQQAEHNREQHRIKDRMRWMGEQAKHNDNTAAQIESDAPKVPKEFAVTIGNQTFEKHGEAGEAILSAVTAMLNAGEDSRKIGSYGGFDLYLDKIARMGTAYDMVLTIKGAGEYDVDAKSGSSATGLGLRLQNSVKDLAGRAKELRDQAERDRADIVKLQAQIKPWGQDQELADAKARHTAVIDQLKPKKKEQAKPDDGAPAMSRTGLEPIFEALEGRGLTRKRALDGLVSVPDGEKIAYIDQNFWDILGELEDKGLVNIKC